MARKFKPEEFVDLLTDSKIVEALAKALAPLIALSIDETLSKKLEGLSATVRELKNDNTRLTKQCEVLATENNNLKKELADQNHRIDDLETYSRCSNLIIRGLPEQSSSERATAALATSDTTVLNESHLSVEKSVLAFCNDKLNVHVKDSDIAIAHRLKKGPRDSVRPVIVRFINRRVRNDVYFARKQLKGQNSQVFISEHLTKNASDLFFEARKLLKEKRIFSTWTHNGQVFIKFTSDPSTRAVLIKSKADLNTRR